MPQHCVRNSVILAILTLLILHAALFAQVNFTSGPIPIDSGLSRGASLADYDCDGWLDIYILNSRNGAESVGVGGDQAESLAVY